MESIEVIVDKAFDTFSSLGVQVIESQEWEDRINTILRIVGMNGKTIMIDF